MNALLKGSHDKKLLKHSVKNEIYSKIDVDKAILDKLAFISDQVTKNTREISENSRGISENSRGISENNREISELKTYYGKSKPIKIHRNRGNNKSKFTAALADVNAVTAPTNWNDLERV